MITLKKLIAVINFLISHNYYGTLNISFQGGKIHTVKKEQTFKNDEEFDLN
jgi:hypothetical protein